MNGVGKPKKFTGKGEDFQQWSEKTEAFFAGVIKEFQMMLEWSAEQATDITTDEVELEFTPTVTNTEGSVPNLSLCCSRCTLFSCPSRATSQGLCRQLAEEPVGSLETTTETL